MSPDDVTGERAGEGVAAERALIDTIRKHTGTTEDEARATILRALDRALGNTPPTRDRDR